MANIVVTIKIMPTSPDVDMDKVREAAVQKIVGFAGEGEVKHELKPVAFGISALELMFVMSEEKGDLEPLEKDLATIEGVESVTTTDVRRTLG